jgi:microcystin-dependent protein
MATTTTYGLNKPTVGGDENTWGGLTNDNWDDVDDLLDGTTAITPNLGAGWEVDGVAVTATAAELNILDGVTASTTEINTLDGINTASNFGLVPSGAILLWSKSVATIPSGWFLCDGTNGTPNLTGRFVIHADADTGGTYAPDDTGGSADAIVVAHTHTYSGTTSAAGAHDHTPQNGNGFLTNTTSGSDGTFNYGSGSAVFTGFVDSTSDVGDHTHTFSGTTASTGSSGTGANLPPYYALVYIMKA